MTRTVYWIVFRILTWLAFRPPVRPRCAPGPGTPPAEMASQHVRPKPPA